MNTTPNQSSRNLVLTSGLAASIVAAALVTILAATGGWGRNAATHGSAQTTEIETAAAVATRVAEPSEATQQDFNMARGLSRAFQTVAKRAEPSVVHITQLRTVPLYTRDGFFGMPMLSGQSELRPSGLGSGNIVTSDGYILTNNHVVKGSEQLKVRLVDGREFPAKLVGRDEATDLAVIKIDAKNLTPIDLGDSDRLEVGEWVVALGSPLGLSNSVTAGIVSAKGRSGISGLQDYQDFIQTDAAINPGNSGGALVNLEGKLVGVNSAIASRSGGYEGIGFAIPSNVAKTVMQSIISSGRVSRGWLGIDLEDVQGTASSQRGVRVAQILETGPAASSGLKPGDIVTEFNGRTVEDSARLRSLIALTPPGTKVDVGVVRDGKRVNIATQLGDQSKQLAAAIGGTAIADLGLTVRTLTRDEARKLNYRNVKGVVVLRVEPASRADNAEFMRGDIIVSIDDRQVDDTQQLQETLGTADYANGVRFGVIRGRQRGSIEVRD